jgi:hypothetical protein
MTKAEKPRKIIILVRENFGQGLILEFHYGLTN